MNMSPISPITTIYFDEITCIARTQESGLGRKRDEMYIRSVVRSPEGVSVRRLPYDDDYYEFWTGTTSRKDISKKGEHGLRAWTNKDQRDVGPPVIWSGHLLDGQWVDAMITIMEQDSREMKAIRQGITTALDTISSITPDPKLKLLAQGAKQLAGMLPNTSEHDFIGALYVRLERTDNGHYNQRSMSVLPVNTKLEAGQSEVSIDSGYAYEKTVQSKGAIDTATVVCHAAGSNAVYQGVIVAS
jgi:hypothetical protein